MKRIYLLLFVIVVGLTSCKKFLDTEPTSFVTPANFYKTQDQLQTALNSVYNTLINGEALYGPPSSMFYRFGFTSDESIATQYPETQLNYDAGNNTVRGMWSSMYGAIYRDNLLLANIDAAQIDAKQKNIIKGQALFLRGYYYYILTICFGDVPLITEPSSTVTGDLSIARTPKKQVYDQILSDMKTAESLLAGANYTVKSLGYAEAVTVDAVRGILAKVCLTMASPGASGTPVDATKYQDVVDYANKLITSPDFALNPDYKQIFKNLLQDKYDVKESIWEAGLYGTTFSGGSSFTFYASIRNSPGGSGGNSFGSKKLFDSYAKWDSVRFNWNCPGFFYTTTPTTFNATVTPVTNGWYNQPGKWRRIYESTFVGAGGTGQSSYNGCNMPLLRLADVYLMKAEAENQLNGPTQAAYDAINAVRRRAFKVPTTTPNAVCDLLPGISKGAFQDSLKVERMRELCFEGARRWDEVRWGSYVDDLRNLVTFANATFPASTPAGQSVNPTRTAYLAISPKHFLLPIPNLELQLNKKLTQNPGW